MEESGISRWQKLKKLSEIDKEWKTENDTKKCKWNMYGKWASSEEILSDTVPNWRNNTTSQIGTLY